MKRNRYFLERLRNKERPYCPNTAEIPFRLHSIQFQGTKAGVEQLDVPELASLQQDSPFLNKSQSDLRLHDYFDIKLQTLVVKSNDPHRRIEGEHLCVTFLYLY